MKPLSLKVSGLHSFREQQEIDFTALCQSGVFGIFGPTGSGKSTVLDAITLALYGKVERAKNGTQGIINQNEDKAFVQFNFAIGGQEYSAERTYKRNKDGSISMRSCRLIGKDEAGEQVLAERAREMADQVQQLIGLTVDDFTRAVVLPQGKFAEFLTLQGKDRRQMLERLFGLEKYGEQLSRKVKTRLGEAEGEHKLVASRQAELGNASADALKEAEEKLQQQQRLYAEIEQVNQQHLTKFEELKQIRQWQTELETQRVKAQALVLKQPEIDRKQEKLALAQRAQHVKPYLDTVTAEQVNQQRAIDQARQLAQQVKLAEEAFQQCQQQYDHWQLQTQTLGKELEAKILRLDEAVLNEQKRDQLQAKQLELRNRFKEFDGQYKQLQQQIKALEISKQELQLRKTELAQLIENRDISAQQREEMERKREAWKALQEVEKRLQEQQREVNQRTEQLNVALQQKETLQLQVVASGVELSQKEQQARNLVTPAVSQLEINKRQQQLTSSSLIVNKLEYEQQALTDKQQHITALENQKTEIQQQITLAEADLTDQNNNKKQLIKEIEQLEEAYKKLERDNLAIILKAQLRENQPCPVCGSTDHPHPVVSGHQQAELEATAERINDAKIRLQQLEQKVAQINSQGAVLKSRLANIDEEIEKYQAQVATIATTVNHLHSQLGDVAAKLALPELKAAIHQQQSDLNTTQKQITDYTAAKEKLTKEIDDLRAKYNEQQRQFTAADTATEALTQQIRAMQRKNDALITEREDKYQQFVQLAAGMSGEEIEAKVIAVNQALKELEQLRKEEKTVSAKLDAVVNDLFQKQELLQNLKQNMEALVIEGKAVTGQVDELVAKINEVTDGLRAADVKEAVTQQLAQLNNAFTAAGKKLEGQRWQWEEQRKLYYSAEQQVKQIKERLEKAEQVLVTKLQEYQFVTRGQAEEAICSGAEMEQLQQQIDQYKQEQLITKESIEQLQQKLNGRSLTEDQWQQFNDEMKQIQLQLDEVKEQVYVLTDRLETLKKNHLRWQQLEEQKITWQREISKLKEMEKLLRGNTFVQFIAEEQLIHVALDASRRLGELTQYKYALEVDSEGNFIIRDDANGGMRRPVSSLSGGETFLTSLALALALSSQIQLHGQYPLEFFFLDEGFGTLDGGLLETVMNSLERLHTENMAIGVISHVPELKARMARRLIVEPAEKGGRGTRLQMETA
ncbi:SbcC/MukB-like Walker B domain-containing protein [Peptococcaceae bacterium 1198_IL3148]